MSPRIPLLLAGLLAGAAAVTQSATAESRVFPPSFDGYLASGVRLTAGERERLLNGEPVTQLLDRDVGNEVAVFGAAWIDAPMRRYVEAVSDIETFEKGGSFKVTKRISAPPRLDDFAALRLPDEDLKDLRSCRVGDCQVKLGEAALNRFRSDIDWTAPDARARANGLMQQLAFEYVSRYLEGGNQALPVYRDGSRPTFVAREFQTMVDRVPLLTPSMPHVQRHLLDFPRDATGDAVSFLYWQETAFGLKPTIRISHLTIRATPEDTVIASKMLYASHYFWTGLELRVLMPDASRGSGFWYVTVNRSRSDGLSGFTGMFVRRRVRSEVERLTLTSLRSTKARLERAARAAR